MVRRQRRSKRIPTNNHFKGLQTIDKFPVIHQSFNESAGEKCSARHIDATCFHGRISLTEILGCITGTQFFWMNSAPNCVFDDGDNLCIHLQVKVVFIAVNLLNQLTIFCPVAEAA